MENRKKMIDTILSGDMKRIAELSRIPQIYFIQPCSNGKFYSLSFNKEIKSIELTLSEIEELKKKHCVVISPLEMDEKDLR